MIVPSITWERETDTHIYFQRGILSQWPTYPMIAKLTKDGEYLNFNCCEQYMMASKAILFNDYDSLKMIFDTDSPKEQRELGRKVKGFNNYTWDRHALSVVYRANMAKFTQHAELITKLINTANKTLVEGAWYDKVWGVGLATDNDLILDEANWRGKNWLGIALMNVRGTLLNKENYTLTFEYLEY